jgi:S1-C subfamily serine protease
MKNIKFGAFFLGLTLAVVAAVSVAAQDRRDMRVFGPAGGQLGISISDTANGVRVDTVHAGTPAEKAGIREGDLVVEFDGERVRSAMQLTRLVHETPEGRQVAVAVMRDGKRQTLQATPEARGFDPELLARELRELPRQFKVMPPEFNFRYDDRPRRFEYRVPDGYAPDWVVPYMGSRGRLGVTVQSLTPDLEEYFGARNGGALVSSVSQDSAAAKAGIKAGDVITSINGRSVSDSGDLTRELRDLTGEITIVVLRDKKELTLKATLTRASGVL